MISSRTRYAIKALVCLARLKKGELIKTSEIAVSQSIPRKFLEQILLDLKRASLVSSQQGAYGGYYLLKDAKKITLADVHRLFDGAVALWPCASEKFYQKCQDCIDEDICSLNAAFHKIREQSLKAMEKISIASLT